VKIASKELLRRLNPMQRHLNSVVLNQRQMSREQSEVALERLVEAALRRAKSTQVYASYKYSLDMPSTLALRTLPLTQKEDLHGHEDEYITSQKSLSSLFSTTATSSGSSGLSVSIKRSIRDVAFEQAMLNWWRSGVGWQPNHSVSILRAEFPKEFEAGELFLNIPKTSRSFMNAYQLSDQSVSKYADFLNRSRPDVIYAIPTSLTILLQLLESNSVDSYAPKLIVTSSETVTSNLRELLKRTWDVPLFDWYGNSERTSAAGQCRNGRYHFFWNYAVTEVTANSEVVGTPLQFRMSQFLRYASGDSVEDFSTEPCGCGWFDPHVKAIGGRFGDYVVSASGSRYATLSPVFDGETNVIAGQIIQRASGALDVNVVMMQEDAAAFERMASKLSARVPGRQVSVHRVQELQKTAAGKTKMVIREFEG